MTNKCKTLLCLYGWPHSVAGHIWQPISNVPASIIRSPRAHVHQRNRPVQSGEGEFTAGRRRGAGMPLVPGVAWNRISSADIVS